MELLNWEIDLLTLLPKFIIIGNNNLGQYYIFENNTWRYYDEHKDNQE